MNSWRRSRLMAAVATGLFLVVQMAIPISRLDDTDRGTRFGWHMFSGAEGVPEIVVETVHGEEKVAPGNYLARVRVDVDLTKFPAHLCVVVPGALFVRWDEREYRC